MLLHEDLTQEESERVRASLAKVNIPEDKMVAYVADLMSIIEAGMDNYFASLRSESENKDIH